MTQTSEQPLAKVPSLKVGGDAAAGKELMKRFNEAQTGMRRVMALGLFAWEIKERQLKHGEFGPWLAAHAPKLCRPDSVTGKPKATNALTSYMDMSKGVLSSLGFTVEKYFDRLPNSLQEGICHRGKFLMLPEKKVPADARELREKICALIDGKTKKQVTLDYKQLEEDGAGNLKAKRGRLKGQGGASKEQRAAAAAAEERARITALDLGAKDLIKWIKENADDEHIGKIPDATKARLFEANQLLADYLRPLIAARSGVSAERR